MSQNNSKSDYFTRFNITEEEMNRHLDKWIARMEKKAAEKHQFALEQQDAVMKKIVGYLRTHDHGIDDESLLYQTAEFPFSSQDYTWTFNNLMDFAEDQNKLGEDFSIPFENQVAYLKVQDLNIKLSRIWGQGTAEIMIKASAENWREELSFMYDDYQASLK